MTNLIVLRHVEHDGYERNGRYVYSLNKEGEEQVEKLYEEIRKITDSKPLLILSPKNDENSPDKITHETAEYLAKHLDNTKIEITDCLTLTISNPEKYRVFGWGAENLMKLINEQKDGIENFIVVARSDVCDDFLRYLKRLGYNIPREKLGRGEFVHLVL